MYFEQLEVSNMISLQSNRSSGRNVVEDVWDVIQDDSSSLPMEYVCDCNEAVQTVKSALFVVDDHGNAIGNSVAASCGMSFVGDIMAKDVSVASIFANQLTCVVLLSSANHLLTKFIANIFSSLTISLIFGATHCMDYIGSRKTSLRSINYGFVDDSIVNLEFSNVVSGVCASLFLAFMSRGVSVMAVCVPRQATFSCEVAVAFEAAMPLLARVFGHEVHRPAPHDYHLQLLQDKFVSNTENLYT